jgi:plastocyanin
MRRWLPLAVLVLPLALTFCNDGNDSILPIGNGNVEIRDDCDSVSFNAGIAPNTCMRAGSTSLSAFTAELNANHSVAAWTFVPTTISVIVGGAVTATNTGGETHTFTKVVNYGGGVVPALNAAAGYTAEAPECAALAPNALIASGGTFTTDPTGAVGVQRYQCCIHPWMRATVNVLPR